MDLKLIISFIDADVVLDFTLCANGHIRSGNDILADVAVFAYLRTGEDVGKMPDFGSFAVIRSINLIMGSYR